MKNPIRHSLGVKLWLTIAASAMISVGVIGYIGLNLAKDNLLKSYSEHLVAIKESKRLRINDYFNQQSRLLMSLSQNPTVLEGTVQLRQSFAQLPNGISPSQLARLQHYYKEYYNETVVKDFLDVDGQALFAQYYMLVAEEPEKKASSQWMRSLQWNERLHEYLNGVRYQYHLYDLFLIEPKELRVIYSTTRELDYGTRLRQGPYAKSGLGKVAQQASQFGSRQIAIVDFEHYGPSRFVPAIFMATPLFAGGELIGVVAIQLSIAEINRVMTDDRSWGQMGLGKSGETYLLGNDLTMRNDARGLLENPDQYLKQQQQLGLPTEKLELIRKSKTSILYQSVQTEAASLAMSGVNGVFQGQDYRGVQVLSAFGPVNVFGLKWGIVAEIELQEALDSYYILVMNLMWGVLLILLFTLLIGTILHRRIVRPIQKLSQVIQNFDFANPQLMLPVQSEDELGRLINNLNQMTLEIRNRTISLDYFNNILSSMSDTLIVSYGSSKNPLLSESVIQTVNASLVKLLGYEKESDLIGKPFKEILVGGLNVMEGMGGKRNQKAELRNFKVQYRHRNGDLLPMLFSCSLIQGQQVGFISVAKDISEIEGYISELQTHRANLDRAQEIAHVGNWIWDVPTGVITWSNEIFRIFGETPQAFEPTYDHFVQKVHPEDRDAVNAAVNNALENKNEYRVEHRVVRGDGSIRIVMEKGAAEYSSDGAPLRMLGTVLDITDYVRLKNSLELSEKVFQTASEGIAITDSHANVLYVNPSFTQITGYEREYVIGKNMRIVKSQRQDKAFYAEMWKRLNEEGFWEGEIWNRRRNGQIFPEWLAITRIEDPLTEKINYVAVFHDLSELKKTEEKARFQANHDALTGLPKREVFKDRLEQWLQNEAPLAVVLVNIDRFKKINTDMGFVVGDEILVKVAERLHEKLLPTSTLARWAGDEFAILMEQGEDVFEVVRIVEDIRKAFVTPFFINREPIFVTLSFGIASYPNDGKSAEALLRNAELALKKAKESGGNAFQLLNEGMINQVRDQIHLEAKIRRGLENGEFLPHFQPKVQIASGKIVSAEALARWESPEEGLIPPYRFISLAEETGLIEPLGELILHKSCQAVKEWRRAGFDKVSVGVNLSARQFRRPRLVQEIETILNREGLVAADLEVEVTESLVMGDLDGAISKMRELRELGIRISMDDFGTGYSSLSYLKLFPLDVLKIDQSFIRKMTENPEDARIAKLVVDLGKSLNLNVIAEGVETKEHLDMLRLWGCEEIQGFYFSRPVPKELFIQMLKEGLTIQDIEKRTAKG